MTLFRWIFKDEVDWLTTLVAGFVGTLVYFAVEHTNRENEEEISRVRLFNKK